MKRPQLSLTTIYKSISKYIFFLTSIFTLIIFSLVLYYFYNILRDTDAGAHYWKETFDHNISIIDKVSLRFQKNNIILTGIDGIQVDENGVITKSNIAALSDLDISPSAFFRITSKLPENEIHIGIYPDFITGKPRVYIAKRKYGKVIATLHQPGVLFPVNSAAGATILVTTQGRVLYSNNSKTVGSKVIKRRILELDSRFYLSTALNIRQMQQSEIILLQDITPYIVTSLIILVISLSLTGLNIYMIRKMTRFLNKANQELEGFHSLTKSISNEIEHEMLNKTCSRNFETILQKYTLKLANINLNYYETSVVANLISQFLRKSSELIIRINLHSANQEKMHQKMIETQMVALKEKDILIKEIHHRVKNNLQIVISLLQLQANTSQNSEFKESIKVTTDRIHSMALVHEQLYGDVNLVNISPEFYFSKLAKHLFNSYGEISGKIDLKTNISRIALNEMIPLGLITNEFITNTIKHAKVSNGAKKVSLNLIQNNGVIQYLYHDNGEFFNAVHMKSKENSLGLELIRNLVLQLGSTLEFTEVDGKYNYSFFIKS